MRTRHGWIGAACGVAVAALVLAIAVLAPPSARADDGGAGCATQTFGDGLDPGLLITLQSCARQDTDGSYVVTATLSYSGARPTVTSCELSVEGWTEGSPAGTGPLSHSTTDCRLAVRYGDTQTVETRYASLPAGWQLLYGLASFTASFSDRDGDTAGGWSPVVAAPSS